MHKILLIVKREYLTRVRKKSFIIMTILGPLIFASFMIIPVWLAMMEGDEKTIEILDETGHFEGKFEEGGSMKYEYINASIDAAKSDMATNGKYGLLHIPPNALENPSSITFFSQGNPSYEVVLALERAIKHEIEDIKLSETGINKELLESIKTNVSISTINLSSEGEKASSFGVSSAIGYLASLLIYFFVFLYGAQIMRGVLEEKTSRIVEVIISSVKPFQLMTGKIIGIGAVGLTQFLLWVVLTFAVASAIGAAFQIDRFGGEQFEQTMADMPQQDMSTAKEINEIFVALEAVDILSVIICFVCYFLGGYLLYGALFAAVGSAVDSDADSQQFMFPISMPLIASIVVLSAVIKDPSGSLAFWMSMIPFTSPVVMMMRIPFGVPMWEILLSLGLLALGFIFTTWMAGRIYRIGILMHGTKINYRVLAKWLFMKG